MSRRANAVTGGAVHTTHCGPLDKFTRHRAYNSQISRHLQADENLMDLSKRIGNCAPVLGLEIAEVNDSHLETRLRSHRACNARLCPWCEWRRTKAWRARLINGLEALEQEQPKLTPVFLTLTVRNPLLTDLRETIAEMNLAWRRMTNSRWFPTPYWFRRTEITIGSQPNEPDKAHPHFHVLLMVPPSYWGKKYIKQSEWQKQWMMALRADYIPVIDIRRAKSKPKSGLKSTSGKNSPMSASTSAAIEAAKYLSKATQLIELGDTMPEFHWQTRGLRLYACSKSLRSFIPQADISAEEMNDATFTPEETKTDLMYATAVWFEDTKQYLFSDVDMGPPLSGSKHPEGAMTGTRGGPA